MNRAEARRLNHALFHATVELRRATTEYRNPYVFCEFQPLPWQPWHANANSIALRDFTQRAWLRWDAAKTAHAEALRAYQEASAKRRDRVRPNQPWVEFTAS
jgi:hypothetical protein